MRSCSLTACYALRQCALTIAQLCAQILSCVQVERTILPDMAAHAEYKKVLVHYNKLYKALKPIYHGSSIETDAVQSRSTQSSSKSSNSSGGITLSDALGDAVSSTSSNAHILRYNHYSCTCTLSHYYAAVKNCFVMRASSQTMVCCHYALHSHYLLLYALSGQVQQQQLNYQ
jgi:hypothetical protein